jgi:hypothetical protein
MYQEQATKCRNLPWAGRLVLLALALALLPVLVAQPSRRSTARAALAWQAAAAGASSALIAYKQAFNVHLMDGAGHRLGVVTTRGTADYTTGPSAVTYPWFAWSPDGRYLLLVRENGDGPSWDMLLLDPQGNVLRTLATGSREAPFYPSWALDADQIAYVSDMPPSAGTVPVDGIDVHGRTRALWRFQPLLGCGGGGWGPAESLRMREQGYGFAPTLQWSVRQGLAVFSNSCLGRVVGLDARTGRLLWPSSPTASQSGEAALAPTGRLALVRPCQESQAPAAQCLVLANARTGATQRVVAPQADLPSWSPDGQTLYFVQHSGTYVSGAMAGMRPPRPRILVMRARADGSHTQRLMGEDAYATGPLHPTAEGRALIFSRIPDDRTWWQKLAALPGGIAEGANWSDPTLQPFIPRTSIQRLDLRTGDVMTLVGDAGQPAIQLT